MNDNDIQNIKEYLKQNLRIELTNDEGYKDKYIKVSLYLNNELISSDWV